MAIKNYTSDIPINRIFQRIQDSLAQHGARQISFDYGNNGKVGHLRKAGHAGVHRVL
jgi:hypothetical protein